MHRQHQLGLVFFIANLMWVLMFPPHDYHKLATQSATYFLEYFRGAIAAQPAPHLPADESAARPSKCALGARYDKRHADRDENLGVFPQPECAVTQTVGRVKHRGNSVQMVDEPMAQAFAGKLNPLLSQSKLKGLGVHQSLVMSFGANAARSLRSSARLAEKIFEPMREWHKA